MTTASVIIKTVKGVKTVKCPFAPLGADARPFSFLHTRTWISQLFFPFWTVEDYFCYFFTIPPISANFDNLVALVSF